MPHAGASHLVEAAAESDKGRRPPIIPARHTRTRAHTVEETIAKHKTDKKKIFEQANAGAMQVQEKYDARFINLTA